MRFHHVPQTGLELLNSGDLPSSGLPKCWDHRREPLCLAHFNNFRMSHSVTLSTITLPCNHFVQNIFIFLKGNSVPIKTQVPPFRLLLQPLATTVQLPASMNLTTLGASYWQKLQCLSFCVWFTSLSIISSRFVRNVACVRVCF